MTARLVFFFMTVFVSLSSVAQINTDQVMANGRNALYFEDYVLSIQYFNRVINAKPYLSEPYFMRAYAKFSLDDIQGALADCDKTLSINPYHVDAYNLRGIIKQRLDTHQQAIADFTEGLVISPENTHLLTNRGNSYLSLKEYDEAIADYNRVIGKDPNLTSIYLNRGIARINQTDTIGALADFSHVVNKNPYMADGFWYRAIVYSQTKQYENALADYDKAIHLKPDEPEFYLNRGITRYQVDSLQGAMDDLNKAIELDPKNRLAILDRGLLRAEVGDLNRAIDDFSRVLALDPSDMITLYNRALVYAQIGQFRAALADLNIIIESYPDYAQAYMNRSYVKSMLNDTNGANLDMGTAYKLEMQRREKQDKGGKTLLADKQDKDDKKKKETRDGSDKDIRNYDKVAVLNDFETKEKEPEQNLTSIRGKIQYRDIFVDMEPMFGASLSKGDTLSVRVRYFDKDLERFNKKRVIKTRLQFSNHEEPAAVSPVNYFDMAVDLTEDMDRDGKSADVMFLRGTLFGMVMNFNQAIADFTESLQIEPNNKLTLLNRALIRYKMVEAIQSVEQTQLPSELTVQNRVSAKPAQTPQSDDKNERIIDYDLILADLNRAIQIDERFSFAYFNRGIVMCIRKDYEGGLADFGKAIELNPDFAEAYFNRGLTYIFLKQEEKGIADLGKAGELGLYKAYNVIKRYTQKETK
ncbi:MAG: tetratricopeptide repeat protein [Breznakibacter sp.]